MADPRVDQPAQIDALGSTIDLAPSILKAAQLEPYHDIQGRDLGNVIAGSGHLGRHALLVEEDSYHVDVYGFDSQYRARTLVTETHRMTIYLGEEWGEIYDLDADPDETNNLWGQPESVGLKQDLIWQLTQQMMDCCSRSPWPKREA